MKKKLSAVVLGCALIGMIFAGCGGGNTSTPSSQADQPALVLSFEISPQAGQSAESATILVAAAASLEYAYTGQLIPMFQELYPHINVTGIYDSSGRLQTQIQEGLEADVFMSAAKTQMATLVQGSFVDAGDVVELLENRIVLITPASSTADIASFEDIVKADFIALGDPDSVPVGQYAREALTSLGIYDDVAVKASFGSNVTEVLGWVAEGSADAGIVYATDAMVAGDRVKVLAEAPEGSLMQKVIYPVGILSASQNREAALLFVNFLSSPEALRVFEEYGFNPA